MNKIFVIRTKNVKITLLIILICIASVSANVFTKEKSVFKDKIPKMPESYFEPVPPAQGSLTEIYQDVFVTLLAPCIQDAVTNYYEKNMKQSPSIDPWDVDVISIDRANGYRTFLFYIKLKVHPYVLAHNNIGDDLITVKVSYGETKVEKFEHIKSYPVPPSLQ